MLGMRELRDHARFALEALGEIRVGRQRREQHLDGDRSVEPRVAGLVDLAHTAGAERGDDFVDAETGAGGEGQGSRQVYGRVGQGTSAEGLR